MLRNYIKNQCVTTLVLKTLKDKGINLFYCSPYKRNIDTIRETADHYKIDILTDECLREREKGVGGNNYGMYQKRWTDHNYHKDDSESIEMVRQRNIETLKAILEEN